MNATTFLVVFTGWIFSLCLHEFSHALVAYFGGDVTVRDKGYLTFNPLKYTHPVYSLFLPLLFLVMGGIGLPGGAVYIEKGRLRNGFWEMAVSLAGPSANALVAVILGLIIQNAEPLTTGIWPGLAFLAFLQISAVVLNLIPLPPFDGFGALEPFLPVKLRSQLAETRGMLSWVVIILLWQVPVVSQVFWRIVSSLAQMTGVPLPLVGLGLDQFMFW